MGLDRKRKSISSLQNTAKKNKSLIEKQTSSEDSESENNNVLNEEVKNENPVISRWPQDDIQTLLSRIETALPKNDSCTFRSRLSKFDWSKVQFNNYSKDECQSTWLAIQDQLKTFKTLNDLVQNAKNLLATKGIDTYQSKQNRVQKPRSAYMLYYTEILQKYKKKHPELKLPQLTQIIAEKYKTLSPEKKQVFVDRAQKLKTEYIELVDKANIGFKPKTAEIAKPKTPFQIFIEMKLTDVANNVDKGELQNHYKEKWDKMTEKKKSKWIKLAKEREQIYLNTLKEDHKNDPAFTMPTKSALTKGDREILDSQSGKPKKPPVNNYGLFSKEMLQSSALYGVPPKERMTMLAKKWKSFTNEERQIYSDKLKVITERYKTEYEAYLNTLTEEERHLELLSNNKIKPKKAEPKVVPRINAREGIPEKPNKKIASKKNQKNKTFENEPKPVPFKNAFELYRSKLEPTDKNQISCLEEWNNKSGRKQMVFEDELKMLKKQYMKDLKVFLKSLSEDDLKLYLKLRKPELVTETKNSDEESSASEENEDNSSSEEGEEREDDEDEDEDDDDDDEEEESDDSD